MQRPSLTYLAAAGAVALLTSASAFATSPCFFTAHEPENLRTLLDANFAGAGLYYLPPSFTGIGSQGAGRSDSLFRQSEIVGQLKLTVDTPSDSQDLAVYDALGSPLLLASERVHVCGAALCKEIAISTRREVSGVALPNPQAPQPAETLSPFFLRYRLPADGADLEAYLYGQRVSLFDFQQAFQDSLQWLERAVVETDVTTTVQTASDLMRLQFALVQNGAFRPYYDLVTIGSDISGVSLAGAVPSTAMYNLLVESVLDQGLVISSDRLVIDTRLERVPVRPAPLVCY